MMDPRPSSSNRARGVLGVIGALVCGAGGACGACGDDRVPAGKFHASGTLIHDGLADGDRAGWATELEILKSRRLIDEAMRDVAAAERERITGIVERGVVARRRDGSRLIELTVYADDAPLAQAACNQLLRTYLEQRLTAAMMPAQAEAQRLTEELEGLRDAMAADAGPPDAEARYQMLLGQLRERDLAGAMRRNDVRLLDSCRLAGTGGRS